MKILSNKKVFITGAASGIGRATAQAMGKPVEAADVFARMESLRFKEN